jgi:hypothetical protein
VGQPMFVIDYAVMSRHNPSRGNFLGITYVTKGVIVFGMAGLTLGYLQIPLTVPLRGTEKTLLP